MWEAHQENEAPMLPLEYQRHGKVFSEEGAKRFPPKRDGELTIPLMPDIPKVLDCKVYPLTKEERDLLCTCYRLSMWKNCCTIQTAAHAIWSGIVSPMMRVSFMTLASVKAQVAFPL